MPTHSTVINQRILLIEDDASVAELVLLHLREEGYGVEWAADGLAGWARLNAEAFDLLLLDLVVPGIDGLEICRRLRNQPRYTPVIMISSKAAEPQRILGLELGADDYVGKPFSVFELVARVRALLRRVAALTQAPAALAAPITAGRLQIDPTAREVRLGGETVALTAKEFDLLHFFAQQPGRVFNRLELLNQVWGYAHDGYEHTVNSHINRLRAKIEADPSQPKQILTVWGVGYKFAGGGDAD